MHGMLSTYSQTPQSFHVKNMLFELLTISALGLLPNTPTATPSGPATPTSISAPTRLASVNRIEKKAPPKVLVPDNTILEKNGATIGKITIIVKDIFDIDKPKESGPLYRLVNTLHYKTRETTVAETLLFKSGDPYSALSLQESERILRNERYIFDARIRPTHYENNVVDLEVITTDVWTLALTLSFSREGGENTSSFEIRESNLLGTGKEIRLRRVLNVDRSENVIAYRDPNLGNHHGQLELEYSDNSDGLSKTFNLKRPFFSLESREAYEINYELNEQTDSLYKNGLISEKFQHISELYEASIGYSRGVLRNKTRRWNLGFTGNTETFSATNQTSPSFVLPQDRKFVYPWIGYSVIENNFIKTKRLNFINRTEDLNLGQEYSLKIGWSDKSLSSYTNTLIYEARYGVSYTVKELQMYLSELTLSGRLAEGKTENLSINSITKFYYNFLPHQVFHYKLDVEVMRNSDEENQLFLGGETGLRGYPIRLQEGNRKVLFTMEHRFYTDWHILQLLYVGGAVFFDIGRAWGSGLTGTPNTRVLKDVGFGLRISSSRAGKGKVLHVNFAYPMDGDDTIDNFQFSVGTKATF